MDEGLRTAIEGAYAAALDDGRWADWTWQTASMLGGACGAFHVVEAPGVLRHQQILLKDPAPLERYVAEDIGRLDPQLSYVGGLRRATVFTDTDHADRDDPATREYFAWQAANGKLQHYLTAAVPLDGGRICAGLSVHRHVEDGATPTEARRRLEMLLPDIQRALELGFVHAAKLTDVYWDGLLTRRTEPCLLLSERGTVLRATPPMEALLRHGDGLRCRHGRLTCGGGIADAVLDRFIGLATTGVRAPGTCRIDRPSGKSAYILNAYPLHGPARPMAPLEAVALVTLIDPDTVPQASPERWQQAFGLTRRERDLAEKLVAGHSLETAANSLKMSVSTARVHLRHIFSKTYTGRQAELIQLLARIGA